MPDRTITDWLKEPSANRKKLVCYTLRFLRGRGSITSVTGSRDCESVEVYP